MNTEKEFVPYEEALTLKELGFDEPCFDNYNAHGFLWQMRMDKQLKIKGACLAPTFSQVFRWFRENYKLHSYVDIQNVKLDWYDYEILEVKNGEYNNDLHIDMNFKSHEEAELACLRKLIEIVKNK